MNHRHFRRRHHPIAKSVSIADKEPIKELTSAACSQSALGRLGSRWHLDIVGVDDPNGGNQGLAKSGELFALWRILVTIE